MLQFKRHFFEHEGQTWARQPPHLSVAKFPQQPSVEHVVLLELVDVLDPLDPALPLDTELRLELEPGLCDFEDLLGKTIRPCELDAPGDGGGGSTGTTGALPVF